MDPLSITGTSIAIVQLVAQITKVTRSYTKSVKGADETVKSFIAEIGSLAAVLDVLREDEEKNGGWREVRRKLGIQPSSGDGEEAEKTPNGAVVVVGTDGGEEAAKKNPNAAMSLLWTNLQECHREMREMLQKLEDGTKQKRGWWKKKMKLLMWPLEETEVEAWLAKVERWKATVSLALKVEDR